MTKAAEKSMWAVLAKISSAVLGILAGYVLRDPSGLTKHDIVHVSWMTVASFFFMWYCEYRREKHA